MKKGFLALLIIIVLSLLSVFIFIPGQLHIAEVTEMNGNINAVYRHLANESKWANWWPKMQGEANTVKTLNDFSYSITKKLYNAMEIKAANEDGEYGGNIVILPVSKDSIAIKWENHLYPGINPFKRISQYKTALKLKKNMNTILESLKAYAINPANLYKYNIHRTTLTDTVLISTKMTTKAYPETPAIYNMIANLEKYIAAQGAKETNYPMLNITKLDSQHFVTMVAIPTNKALSDKGDISFKRMMVYKDKIVTAEVTGGPEAIKQAYEEIDAYLNDYQLAPPVIHFEYLVTDRLKEKDTTKWKTIIYYPII